jgi:hypothetical protein
METYRGVSTAALVPKAHMEVNGQPQASLALLPGKKLWMGLRTDLDVLEKRKSKVMIRTLFNSVMIS